MSEKTDHSHAVSELPITDLRLVARSHATDGRPYAKYREELRFDFFHSCAYCTITEFEAQSVPMTIDHYEPRQAHPELEHDYENLMYACQFCNVRKSDRYPPIEARADGHRFFRPDHDVREEHFGASGILVEPASPVGEFTIEMLDLNRQNLLRLRKLRQRVAECDALVVSGIMGLRSFRIDKLPREVKGRAATTIARIGDEADTMRDRMDSLLRAYAKSDMIDPDPDVADRSVHRKAYMKGVQALYPGQAFQAPRRSGRT